MNKCFRCVVLGEKNLQADVVTQVIERPARVVRNVVHVYSNTTLAIIEIKPFHRSFFDVERFKI
jgi:hypothetical protein